MPRGVWLWLAWGNVVVTVLLVLVMAQLAWSLGRGKVQFYRTPWGEVAVGWYTLRGEASQTEQVVLKQEASRTEQAVTPAGGKLTQQQIGQLMTECYRGYVEYRVGVTESCLKNLDQLAGTNFAAQIPPTPSSYPLPPGAIPLGPSGLPPGAIPLATPRR